MKFAITILRNFSPGQPRRTERGLSSPQQAPRAQPACESGASRRSNDAAGWKVRAPRFAPAFTDRIQKKYLNNFFLCPSYGIVKLLEAADANTARWATPRKARWHRSRLAKLQKRKSSYDQIVGSHQ